MARVMVNGRPVRMVRAKGMLRAMIDRCPHQGKSFEGGWCEDGYVVCPWHRFAFDPATGRSRTGSTVNVEVFEVRDDAQGLFIGIPGTTIRLFGVDLW